MLLKLLKDKKNTPILISFLIGVVFGFIVAPAKKGVTIGSYNGSYNGMGTIPKTKKPQNIDD